MSEYKFSDKDVEGYNFINNQVNVHFYESMLYVQFTKSDVEFMAKHFGLLTDISDEIIISRSNNEIISLGFNPFNPFKTRTNEW